MARMPDEERTAIAAFLRALTQGEGLSVAGIEREEAPGFLREYEPSDIAELIKWSADQLMDTHLADAIRNALGLGEFQGSTLTERREQYLKLAGVSLRTLIRHEQAGADALAFQMMRAIEQPSTKSASKIAQLEQQINDLQILVARLILSPESRDSSIELVSESVERRVIERANWAAQVHHLTSLELVQPLVLDESDGDSA
jgi:hypothetical protein